MMPSTQSISDNLRAQLVEIDKQIEAVKAYAERQYPIHIQPDPDAVYKQQDRDGNFLMIPLVLARTNVLLAMANLKASENQSKGPRR